MDWVRTGQAGLLAVALLALLVLPWGQAQRDDRTEQGFETDRWAVHPWWTTAESTGPDGSERQTSLAGPDGALPLRNLLAAAGFTVAVLLAGLALLPAMHRHPRRRRIAFLCTGVLFLLLAAAHAAWSPFAGLHETCGAALEQSAAGVVEHRCWMRANITGWFVSVPVLACAALLAVRPRAATAQAPLPAMPEPPGVDQRNS